MRGCLPLLASSGMPLQWVRPAGAGDVGAFGGGCGTASHVWACICVAGGLVTSARASPAANGGTGTLPSGGMVLADHGQSRWPGIGFQVPAVATCFTHDGVEFFLSVGNRHMKEKTILAEVL